MTNVEKHIEREIDRILADPPNSDFQRGYFDALIVIIGTSWSGKITGWMLR